MSLVIGYFNQEYAIIISDGRAGTENEYYDKTLKLNDNIIFGYVGYAEEAEMVLPCIKSLSEITSVDELLEILEHEFSLKPSEVEFRTTFMFIGIDNIHNMALYQIGDLTNFKMQKSKLTSGLLHMGGTTDYHSIDDIVRANMFNKNELDITERMKKSIEDVSKIDSSVNNNIFIKTISRKSKI